MTKNRKRIGNGRSVERKEPVGRLEMHPASPPSGLWPRASAGWSVMRKREVVLRLLRGGSWASKSYRLEEWKQRAFSGIDASLREREATAERVELDTAMKRLGELMMRDLAGRPPP